MKTASRIKIVLIENGKVGKFQDLPQPGEKALAVKAHNGLKILFVDDDDQYAPENLSLSREGDDLLIFLEGSMEGQPELIVENYYQSQNVMLIGQAENGEYYEFITSDGTHFSLVQAGSYNPLILGGNPAPLAPGAAVASSSSSAPTATAGAGVHDWGKLGWAGLGILGAGALVWGIYEIDHDDDSNHYYDPSLNADIPEITSVLDDVQPVTGQVANNGYTNDASPTLSGTAKADSIVSVYRNGSLIGSTTADANGKWSFQPAADLAEGNHVFYVTATLDGKVSESSDTYTISVDVTAPVTPGIQGIQAEDGKHETPVTEPTVYGQAEAGSIVKIYLDDKLLGSTKADQSGNWSYTPRGELVAGDYTLHVVATDAAGNASGASADYALSIITPVLSISQIKDAVTEGYINTGEPEIQGMAVPGQTVVLKNGDTILGSALADSEGNWAVVPTTTMIDGTYALTAVVLGSNGEVVSSSAAFSLTVDTERPDIPVISEVRGSEGSDAIENGGSLADARPVISGLAEAGSVVMLYNGEAVLGSVVTDASGNWSFTPEQDLTGESYNLVAKAVDAAGNTSNASEGFGFTIDQVVPEELTILYMYSTENPDLAPIESDGRIYEARPTFAGTGEPGSFVTLYQGDEIVGTTTIDASGHWSIVSGIDFDSGSYSVSASMSDVAGGDETGWSSPFPFAVSLMGETYEIGVDPSDFFSNSAAAVHGTEGIDILKLTAADQVLDLDGLTGVDANDGRITSIEIFDLTGTGNNTLVLYDEVFAHMAQLNLFADRDSMQLMVRGDAGDRVDFNNSDSWSATGNTVEWQGDSYAVYHYEGTDLELLVQQAVTTNVV